MHYVYILQDEGGELYIGYSGDGAAGETRTPNPLRELAPEASVSTNFTTTAIRILEFILAEILFCGHR